MKFAGKHVLVLGLGESGLAMAHWLLRCGASLRVADTREAPDRLAALRALSEDMQFISGEFGVDLLDGMDFVAVSPGLSPLRELAVLMPAAQQQDIPVWGEIELFAQALAALKEERAYAPKVIAITGTNGKTTVTSLVGLLCQRAGLRTKVAGNISPAVLDVLREELDRDDVQRQEYLAQAAEEAGDDAAATSSAEPAIAAEAVEVPAAADAAETEVAAEDIAKEGAETEAVATELHEAGSPAASPAADVPAPAPVSIPSTLPQVWALELSSFQLHTCFSLQADVATVLNITQDHLDWHGDLAAYTADKARIFGTNTVQVLNRDDALVMALARPMASVSSFGIGEPEHVGDLGLMNEHGMAWLASAAAGEEDQPASGRRKKKDAGEVPVAVSRLMPVDALKIRGQHNASNALAALALCRAIGLSFAPLLHGLREYQGEPHRVELIATVAGVDYIDDSKGTNVGATVAALKGIGQESAADAGLQFGSKRVILIAGGEGKGQDFSPLAEPVMRYAKAVLLIGKAAPEIRAAVQDAAVEITDFATLEQAVQAGSELAAEGDIVLLSPACASLDMFRNYAHRAQVFVDAVREIGLSRGEVF
ncbi:MAG: UDP-N-acetylmuramoyl-L-alanine--D-glutamate ligase [Pseudomonadota bacterium]